MERAIVKGNPIQIANHPWVYSGNLLECTAPRGSAVEVYSRKGVFLGSAIFNPSSSIALRFYSRKKEELDYFAIKQRLMVADLKRRKNLRTQYYRLAFSESDGLPGLVVDRYGGGFVFQINSFGMEVRRGDIIKALYDAFSPKFLVERSEGQSRMVEGLSERVEILINEDNLDLSRVLVEENEMKYFVDLVRGQKTGFFYDQRKNRDIVEEHVSGGIVLDLFSYSGSFALRALKKAQRVIAVDISEDAIYLLRENVKINGISQSKLISEVKDSFDFLEEAKSLRIKFSFIIMDPPSFARKAKDLDSAVSSYSNLLGNAIDVLERDGQVALFSCSNHIKWEHLSSVLQRGTGGKGREFRILEYLHQDFRDHPVPANFPEAEYLRGYLIKEDI